MARPRKELEDIKISGRELNSLLVDIAVKNKVPVWIAEELIPDMRPEDKDKISKHATIYGEAMFLSSIFPEYKTKIKYAARKATNTLKDTRSERKQYSNVSIMTQSDGIKDVSQ